ncbi:hypothetical protein GCM10018790_67820 [Kitasatospora xanthocidica]|nr:hypothetical protein GCM10018790_67820 [Kitasatospora xanthocidica]
MAPAAPARVLRSRSIVVFPVAVVPLMTATTLFPLKASAASSSICLAAAACSTNNKAQTPRF